jgi:hypothetical protein
VDMIYKHRTALFHATVAKLHIVAKRERLDILLAISFLTTRVKEPDTDDWCKLVRVLGYLKRILNFCLTLTCIDIKDLTWYIDGSYATHKDMKLQCYW